jgi:hypothetical protein
MALELSGKLYRVLPEVRGNGRNGEWIKQDFVIETTDQFPKKICITAWGEKVDEIKQLRQGDDLRVSVNIESREYNEKWYTDVKAWKIETGASASVPAAAAAYAQPDMEPAQPPYIDNDDLPF